MVLLILFFPLFQLGVDPLYHVVVEIFLTILVTHLLGDFSCSYNPLDSRVAFILCFIPHLPFYYFYDYSVLYTMLMPRHNYLVGDQYLLL